MLSDKDLKDIAAGYVFDRGMIEFSRLEIIEYGVDHDVKISIKDAESISDLISNSLVTVLFEDGSTRHG